VNTDCRVTYVENIGRVFNDPVTVNIHRIDDRDRSYYFEMNTSGMRKFTGYPTNLFRFDVVITSDNYEDMRMTVYIRRQRLSRRGRPCYRVPFLYFHLHIHFSSFL